MNVDVTAVRGGAPRKRIAKAAALTAMALAVALSAGMLAGCGSSSGAPEGQGAAGATVQDNRGAQNGGSANGGGAAAGSGQSGATTQPTIGMTDFTTATMDGATFTNEDLADYKLTMVNIWSTTCPYCIEEMPGLELLYQSLPEGVNLVGICLDGDFNRQVAENILSESGVTFPVLLDSESLGQSLTGYVSSLPTTVFVDSKGELVGQGLAGVPALGSDEDVADAYLELIEERLGSVQ